MWMGWLIATLDRILNRAAWGCAVRRMAGVFAIVLLAATVGAAALALQRVLLMVPLGFAGLVLAASALLAQRSLHDHVADVAMALAERGLEDGRSAVAHIVGRDTRALDAAGVARAAIESLAENFSDGVVAPALWLALGGIAGGAVYKAVNTADSMLGHRTARHEHFGCAAARLDDLMNLPASRLAALLLVAASLVTPATSPKGAWRAVWRDAHRHRSPNAGYPEAAMAGALGLALAGPRVYGGVRVEDAFMGEGRRDAASTDIRAALALYRRADAILIGLVAGAVLLVIALG